MRNDEQITCAGTSEWISTPDSRSCENSYYFVTNHGLHVGCGTPKKSLLSKGRVWDCFVPASEIIYARTDWQHAVQFHRADDESLALLWLNNIFTQYVRQDDSAPTFAHHWFDNTALNKGKNIAEAMGITLDQSVADAAGRCYR